MDNVANGVLLGTVNGIISGGAGLVSGKRSRALYTNGVNQLVDLGPQHDNCLGYFVQCANGLVMTMWLQLGSGTGSILASGGVGRRGVMIDTQDEINLLVHFRAEGRENWELSVKRADLQGWNHISVIWNTEFGGKLYVNGRVVDTEPTASIILNKDVIIDDKNHLVLGANNLFARHAEMILDELYIWDTVMNDDEIWAIYVAEVLPWSY